MLLESSPQHTILCIHKPPVTDEWAAYTRYIGQLLGSRFDHRSVQAVTSAAEAEQLTGFASPFAVDEAHAPGVTHAPEAGVWRPAVPDLVIFGEAQSAWWQRPWRQAARAINRTRGPILFARGARRPLRRILWLIRDHESDDAALNWVARLAVPSRAVVTLMPIVPAYPRLYQRGATVQLPSDVFHEHDNTSLLAGYVRRLDGLGVEGSISRRQGDPVAQIRNEVRAHVYDLIVIAAEPTSSWERWLMGEVVTPLLRWADRPVLVAR